MHNPQLGWPSFGRRSLLFGVRLWASTCLALFVAFHLELPSPYWAATSAAIACQPELGASMQKGRYRIIGTIAGAAAIVLLAACFPQSPTALLVALALWGAACAFAATLFRNFGAYAAALAGYTAAIITSEQLGTRGGLDSDIFMTSVSRVSEICVGVFCTTLIFAGTDQGRAKRQLVERFSYVIDDLSKHLIQAIALPRLPANEEPENYSAILRDVIALDTLIDTAIEEDEIVRHHSPALRRAFDSLCAAILACATLTNPQFRAARRGTQNDLALLMEFFPTDLSDIEQRGSCDPIGFRQRCQTSVEGLAALPADSASLRLLADKAAEVLVSLALSCNALALLVGTHSGFTPREAKAVRLASYDWLPAWTNFVRALLAIGLAELFWVSTAWPSGATAITWASITVILMTTRGDQAYSGALGIVGGNFLSTSLSAIFLFAVFPRIETFAGLSVALAAYMVPVGALMAQPWGAVLIAPMISHFFAFLQPTNLMNYDLGSYYNSVLAVLGGCGLAASAFRIIPPSPSGIRVRRLLQLTEYDLRQLASGSRFDSWDTYIPRRLRDMPGDAMPLQRAQLFATLSAGREIIQLHRTAMWLGLLKYLDPALVGISLGDGVGATAHLARLDALIATGTPVELRQTGLRARSSIHIISQALCRNSEDSGRVEMA